MRIAILGATGATGREVLAAALDRGHEVVALARRPEALSDVRHDRLDVKRADVDEPSSVIDAVRGADALISALGISKGGSSTTLSAGAKAVVAADVPRIAWMGTFGAGASRRRAGMLYDPILRMVLHEGLRDKADAETLIAGPSTTIFHPAMLAAGPPTGRAHIVALDDLDRNFVFMPSKVARTDVAATMVGEVEAPAYAGRTVAIL
ncbi:NAD(P)-dependent oxidoreductase [Actinoplanes sp. NPDC049265]|uniref:NAD(P)-dependent oxidoreductase n=1 Tax=Actinoplanes sp. NPDC049265 TaxID=3363902 RepID=UPI003719397D